MTKRIVILFLITGLIFGFAFIVLTPPMTVPDELTHFAKAYGGAEGRFFPKQISPHNMEQENLIAPREWGGNVPVEILDLYDVVAFNFGSYHNKYPWEFLSFSQNSGEQIFTSWGAMAVYPPFAYTPQITGIAIGKLFGASPLMLFYIARLFNLLAYLAVCGLALRIFPFPKWAAILISLNPMALFLAGSVSGDAFFLAVSFLFTTMVFRLAVWNESESLAKNRRLKEMIILCPLLVLLVLMKPLMCIFVLLFWLIPKTNISVPHKVLWSGVSIVASISTYFTWQTRMPSMDEVYKIFGIPSEQIWMLMHHPGIFIRAFLKNLILGVDGDQIVTGTVAYLGTLDAPIGFHWILLYYGLFFIAALYISGRTIFLGNIFQRFIITPLAIILYVIAIFLTLYIVWNPPGATAILGVQGRYFIPLFLLALPPFWGQKVRLNISEKNIGRLVFSGSIIILLVAVYTITQRYSLPFVG